MAGKHHNEGVLTESYLARAAREGLSSSEIAANTGINRRTVYNYMDKYGLFSESETPDEVKLKAMEIEATQLEDQLQRLVFKIDLFRMKMENEDRVDMEKITELARKAEERGRCR